METIKLKAIKSDAIITIQISAEYYTRVQKLLFWFGSQDQAKTIQAIEDLKTRDPQSEFEHNLATILALIYEVENKAQEQGHMTDVEHSFSKS